MGLNTGRKDRFRTTRLEIGRIYVPAAVMPLSMSLVNESSEANLSVDSFNSTSKEGVVPVGVPTSMINKHSGTPAGTLNLEEDTDREG